MTKQNNLDKLILLSTRARQAVKRGKSPLLVHTLTVGKSGTVDIRKSMFDFLCLLRGKGWQITSADSEFQDRFRQAVSELRGIIETHDLPIMVSTSPARASGKRPTVYTISEAGAKI